VKLLIAEDHEGSRRLLTVLARQWGYDTLDVADGDMAWESFQGVDPPPLALLDRSMPGMDGLEICRRLRASQELASTYVILVTARASSDEVVGGLDEGADDYVCKPFQREELRARVAVGARMVVLQRSLADRVGELEKALGLVTQLRGLLPICAWCNRIRDGENQWQRVETYVAERSDTRFSHSICPDCREKHARPHIERARQQRGEC
jgi:phosphoserine phosphatase RsbU/P